MTLQTFFGWVNAPFAWLMGVPAQDCLAIGGILGERIVLNEFIGYLIAHRPEHTCGRRSFTMATYALCGFANFSSIAIQVGGIGSLAPSARRHGPAWCARHDRRIAGKLSDRDDCGDLALNVVFGARVCDPQPVARLPTSRA